MTWETAADIATVIGTVIVVFSVILVRNQLKQQTKLTRAANSQALVDISSPFNLEIIHNEEMAKLWFKGPEEFDGYDDFKKFKVKNSLIWWLIFYENIFLQHREGLLDEAMYFGWNKDLENFISRHNLYKHWGGLKGAYHDAFRIHVNNLIEKDLEGRLRQRQVITSNNP